MYLYADLKEQEVKHIDSELSPHEKVQQALDCLPLPSQQSSFHSWKILDYSKAYSSGEITPLMVYIVIFCKHSSLLVQLFIFICIENCLFSPSY